jgi:uncharacterized membrane protein
MRRIEDISGYSGKILKSQIPFDLKIIFYWLIGVILCIYLPILNVSPFRVFFILPLILFIPGYLILAVLLPEIHVIESFERIALSIGLSIAISPLIGFALNFTPWGIRLNPIVWALIIFNASLLPAAYFRQANLPLYSRYSISLLQGIEGLKQELSLTEVTHAEKILFKVLIIIIIIGFISAIYIVLVPRNGENFTEFFILGEEKAIGDYPTRLTPGEIYPVYIGVSNHEHRNVTYTVEIFLLKVVYYPPSNASSITRMDRSSSLIIDLTDNSTLLTPYNLSSPDLGYNRVEFLLFNETVPGESISGPARIHASYRDVFLWVNNQSSDEA